MKDCGGKVTARGRGDPKRDRELWEIYDLAVEALGPDAHVSVSDDRTVWKVGTTTPVWWFVSAPSGQLAVSDAVMEQRRRAP